MNTRKGVLITVGAVLLAVMAVVLMAGAPSLGARAEKSAGDPSNGSRWEYLVVQGGNVNLRSGSLDELGKGKAPGGSFNRESLVLERNMDKLGAEGWELVGIYGGAPNEPIYYFKRLKE